MAARDEDDLAAAALRDHLAGDELAHVEATDQGSFDNLCEHIWIVVEESLSSLVSRVADEDVDVAEGLDCARDHAFA